jgi:hypothetical protein
MPPGKAKQTFSPIFTVTKRKSNLVRQTFSPVKALIFVWPNILVNADSLVKFTYGPIFNVAKV